MRLKQNVHGVATKTREQMLGKNSELYVYDK
jgi:hypothetical protein